MKALVTHSFQFRGGVARRGSVIALSEAEAKDPFVARNVALADDPRPAPPPYLGNGTPRETPPTPAKTLSDLPDDPSVAQLKDALSKLGVHFAQRMTKAQLSELLAKARAAVAGSAAEPNAPAQKGLA